ncbi:NifB/NifX family molybdenum-iron cluster-binding protein [Marichromatium gracile]|uniref:Putative Fe-Mo cluster-binding NifX family protein n=1 Tax=Marichromatium gracile TaxID=1048 RepID=A0A4R4ADN4_MARGR|nr:NifB/NifX family molybdenum-iron cluster-binding protein [Marichromatium gracile]MBK1709190.1 dinitrogenase iron-molybdenum cofactor biosynthesis protein [Marichromatium gracile]TCW37085.1 putative Fe-Mo cluster-binding NifX family protein [Marichromatium gracile]
MKIVISAAGQGQDAPVDARLGRCAYFAVVDTESGDFQSMPNPFLETNGGAGTRTAQWIAGQRAELLITGRCGPKAAMVLERAGVRVVEGVSGTVAEAVERHAGQGMALAAAVAGREPCDGIARCGGGRGMAHGRGAGAGAGAGAGRGMGVGRGLGNGRGRG